ncbi:MAG TPA: TRAP transporter large permease subunit, partial [Leucothrix sp.]|nr:TRAP transporter large permease subunit [Leucothrix sp.]
MSPQMIGFISIGILFLLIMLGCPIGLAMILVGATGFGLIVGFEPALNMLETGAFETASNYSLTLIPLFLLMG